jgi:hypothetical protein
VFETPAGPVGIFAEVHIFGKRLVLDELLFYPADDQDRLVIGVEQVLSIKRELQRMAAQAGLN